MGKPKRFNVYDSDVESSRRIIENYGRDRQARSVGSAFRSAPLLPPISVTSSTSTTTATFGIGDPIILHEEDLGNITGSVNVDWSKANKFRGILVGNVTLSFINTPPNQGFVQQIILELKQDATGGRTVTFADTFENDHTPIIGKEPDEYNVWAFFASNRGTEPVFSFNTFQSTALVIALSDEDSPLNFASTTVPAVSFRMPYPMIVTEVKISVRTATSGSVLTCDVHDSGTTILSTKVTIDDGETTSKTATTPAVISDNELADDGLIECFLDSRDSGAAARGLKMTIFGYIS